MKTMKVAMVAEVTVDGADSIDAILRQFMSGLNSVSEKTGVSLERPATEYGYMARYWLKSGLPGEQAVREVRLDPMWLPDKPSPAQLTEEAWFAIQSDTGLEYAQRYYELWEVYPVMIEKGVVEKVISLRI